MLVLHTPAAQLMINKCVSVLAVRIADAATNQSIM